MSEQIRQRRHTDVDTTDDIYSVRMPSSARRYQPEGKALVPAGLQPGQVYTGADGVEYIFMPGKRPSPLPPRASRVKQTTVDQAVVAPLPQQRHGKAIVYVLLGVAAAFLFLWLGTILINWWSGVQADWTYTKDFRTFSVDQAVGHGGDSPDHPSHFIIQNDKGRILIIELPADDPQKAVIIPGPRLLGADREPVTATFKDTTGSGRLDLLLHFQGQQVVFLNTGEKFVAAS